jgi:hypothetical protein
VPALILGCDLCGRGSGTAQTPHPLIFFGFFHPGPRSADHELEERRALVGLVRVRPAEGSLNPPGPGDAGGPGSEACRGLSRMSARRRPWTK